MFNVNMCFIYEVHLRLRLYIYIYIERERETDRQTEKKTESEGERDELDSVERHIQEPADNGQEALHLVCILSLKLVW